MRKVFAAATVFVVAGMLSAGEVRSANEQITLENWDQTAQWHSNSACPGKPTGCVAVCDPTDPTKKPYYYDSVDDYIKGVLSAELVRDKWGRKITLQTANPPTQWDYQAGYLEGYKAQAIAARNTLLGKQTINRGKTICTEPYDILNSQDQQVDDNFEDRRNQYQNHLDAVAGDAAGKVVKYTAGGEAFPETTFFSNTTGVGRDATRNSEDYHYWSSKLNKEVYWDYKPQLRNALNVRSDESADANGVTPSGSSHGVGLSQFGAMHMSQHLSNTENYVDILKHYFHPSPSFVKRLKITQGSKTIYDMQWSDIEVVDHHGTRTLAPVGGIQPSYADGSARIDFEVTYSEQMADAKAPSPICLELYVGNVKVEVIRKSGGADENRVATGHLDADVVRGDKPGQNGESLGPGTHQVTLKGVHKYVLEWGLDSNPGTVAFDKNDVNYYEEGDDKNHFLVVALVEPPLNVGAQGQDGNVHVCWDTPPTVLPPPPGPEIVDYRIYRGRVRYNPDDPNWTDSFTLIGEVPNPGTGRLCIDDGSVRNGEEWFYVIQALTADGHESIGVEAYPPLDIALIFDSSGSMAWNGRADAAANTGKLFVDVLYEENRGRVARIGLLSSDSATKRTRSTESTIRKTLARSRTRSMRSRSKSRNRVSRNGRT